MGSSAAENLVQDSVPDVYLEFERAADFVATDKSQLAADILAFWQHVALRTSQFQPVKPHGLSDLFRGTSLIFPGQVRVPIKSPSPRHRLFFDTSDLLLWRAKVQVRIERQPSEDVVSEIGVASELVEATVKVGDKADNRIEESVTINPLLLEEQTFFSVYRQAMLNAGRKEAYKAIVERIKSTAGAGVKVRELELYALLHTLSDTIRAKYRPDGNPNIVFEVKTDNVTWETALGDVGCLAQAEVEYLPKLSEPSEEPPASLVEAQRDLLVSGLGTDVMQPSVLSKPDPGFKSLAGSLLPQSSSELDINRAIHNQNALREALDRRRFSSLRPSDLRMRPAVA